MTEWHLEPSGVFESRSKRCRKKHPKETEAMFNNLDTYLRTLNNGVKITQIKAGFIHLEQMGVIALDQNGAKGKPTQTRLYIYPNEDTHTVYLIDIGEKGQRKVQQQNVKSCCELVKALRREREGRNG